MDKPNNHYKNCVIEPIDVIKKVLSRKEYEGFLLGNVLKYRLRAGHKTEGDLEKAMRYEEWLREARTETEDEESTEEESGSVSSDCLRVLHLPLRRIF